jgi:hypothetical protein
MQSTRIWAALIAVLGGGVSAGSVLATTQSGPAILGTDLALGPATNPNTPQTEPTPARTSSTTQASSHPAPTGQRHAPAP